MRRSSHFAEGRSAWELRRERGIGNWGRASEHVGRRWETLGFAKLTSMVAGGVWPASRQHPAALAALMDDPDAQTALARLGLPSPDVVLVLADGAGGALQALDFKWDLEFASYDQIRASALATLLERDAGVLAGILAKEAGQPLDGMSFTDGLLFAPDSAVNQRFLASNGNQRREYPIEAGEVIFAAVGPEEFFAPLPGWDMARRLATLDRSESSLQILEGAERFYRLGAGLLGGVAQLEGSVFSPAPSPPDSEEAISWLRSRAGRAASSAFVEYLEGLMALRARDVAYLRRITRCPYRFADLTRALTKRGIVVEDPAPAGGELRSRWGPVLRRVAEQYRATIVRSGLRLVQGGMTDAGALAQLEKDLPRFATAARSLADRLIDNALSTTPSSP